MISWLWLIPMLFVGIFFGYFSAAILMVRRSDDDFNERQDD